MRQLIVGPRNSGKSLRAEELMVAVHTDLIIYLATLPKNERYAKRILGHQARRGREWDTLEMDDSPESSLLLIRGALRSAQPVLLDGASILVWRTCVVDGLIDERRAKDLLGRLTELLAACRSDWIIVDASIPYPSLGFEDPFNRLMLQHHHVWRQLADLAD